jgi:hypothetical protein
VPVLAPADEDHVAAARHLCFTQVADAKDTRADLLTFDRTLQLAVKRIVTQSIAAKRSRSRRERQAIPPIARSERETRPSRGIRQPSIAPTRLGVRARTTIANRTKGQTTSRYIRGLT